MRCFCHPNDFCNVFCSFVSYAVPLQIKFLQGSVDLKAITDSCCSLIRYSITTKTKYFQYSIYFNGFSDLFAPLSLISLYPRFSSFSDLLILTLSLMVAIPSSYILLLQRLSFCSVVFTWITSEISLFVILLMNLRLSSSNDLLILRLLQMAVTPSPDILLPWRSSVSKTVVTSMVSAIFLPLY